MDLQIFKNNDFGEIRVALLDNEPYVMLSDVCKVLDIKNVSDTKSRLNPKGVGTTEVLTRGGKQQATFINESNLYKVIFQSRKPEAEQFTEWVTSEVLPAIRKHGIYAKDELLDNPDLLLDVIKKYKEEREEKLLLQGVIEQQKPKVLFADAVATSKTSILVGELAKILKQNGIEGMGQNRLFAWLRENGFLIKRKGTDYNMPTQKSMEMELFEIKETTITHSDGHISVNKTSKVTGKGSVYFVNKFVKERGAV